MTSSEGDCLDVPPSEWPVPPDARCDCDFCEACVGEMCNAWLVEGSFSAHSVLIR